MIFVECSKSKCCSSTNSFFWKNVNFRQVFCLYFKNCNEDKNFFFFVTSKVCPCAFYPGLESLRSLPLIQDFNSHLVIDIFKTLKNLTIQYNHPTPCQFFHDQQWCQHRASNYFYNVRWNWIKKFLTYSNSQFFLPMFWIPSNLSLLIWLLWSCRLQNF